MQHSKERHQGSAFNSRASDCPEEPSNALYEAITKNLNNQVCPQHQGQYEYFYSGRLLCENCLGIALSMERRSLSSDQIQKYQYFYHLKNIMKYPLILLAKQQSLFQCPSPLIDLMLKSYQPLFPRKSDLTIQKQLLNSFIVKIKTKVEALCDSLVANFERAEEHLASIGLYRDEVRHISKMYEQQFQELLGQNYGKGSREQLENILNDYRNNNLNPFDKIFNNLDEVMSHLSQAPIIDTQQLVNLYTTLTDERLWKCNKIISTKASRQQLDNTQLMILNSEQVVLQNQYLLQMTQDGLVLRRDDQQLGRLNVIFDSLYHLAKYRLIGVNYESVQVISYFDRLKVDDIYHIEGCTDILPFDTDIVVISNQNLIKIDLNSKRQTTLGNGFRDLRYDRQSSWAFICESLQGRKVRWSLNSNECCQQMIL